MKSAFRPILNVKVSKYILGKTYIFHQLYTKNSNGLPIYLFLPFLQLHIES